MAILLASVGRMSSFHTITICGWLSPTLLTGTPVIGRRSWNDPPLDAATWERWFGLWRVDGSPKPAVAEVTSFENLRQAPRPDVPWIDIDQEEFSTRPHEHLRRLYRRVVF